MNNNHQSNQAEDRQQRIRLELDAVTLHRLLDSGVLCAGEIRCLDCSSKQCISKFCLQLLSKKMKSIPDNWDRIHLRWVKNDNG